MEIGEKVFGRLYKMKVSSNQIKLKIIRGVNMKTN